MTMQTSSDTIRTILDIHAMIDGFIIEAVEDVPDSRMTEQPGLMGGGSLVNHPAWTLSHLNAYAAMLLAMLDDAPTRSTPAGAAEAEMERFGYGTVPVADRASYATKHELIGLLRERGERLSAVVAEKHVTYFPRAAPERFQPYSPTIGHIAITLLVAHPPHHLGQLKQWRRAAGLATST